VYKRQKQYPMIGQNYCASLRWEGLVVRWCGQVFRFNRIFRSVRFRGIRPSTRVRARRPWTMVTSNGQRTARIN